MSGKEVRVEWGMRRTKGAMGTVINFEGSRRGAERCAEIHGGTVVRREVIYGEWQDPQAIGETP